MRIALFSDIHANLPAFQAMLEDLDEQSPDAVYCLGDLIGYNVWPNEVIAEIRRRGIATLAGNHDLKVENLITTPQSLSEPGKKHAYHLVEQHHRDYLLTLPAHIKLEFKQGSEKLNIVMAHGSTRSVDEYTLFDSEEKQVLKMMEEANADLLFVGHSHKPYHRILESSAGVFKHVINLGSVGKPKDGDVRGCYVLLTIDKNSSVLDPKSIKVEFRRVAYDLNMASQGILESPLPDEFAQGLFEAR
ncbi:MAG: metallophosphoesterase [Pedobacter sp.]|jgi:putative phosphoesterase|nr:MAG: metallophosphoesterase [Pedobacter sp.]